MKRELESHKANLSTRQQDIDRWGTPQDVKLFQDWRKTEGARQTKAIKVEQRVIHREMLASQDSLGRNAFHYVSETL